MKKVLFQGAESRIYIQTYLGKEMMVKERFKKNYRHPELDYHLTKERMKAECRNIMRCKQLGIKTPAIYFVDLENRLIYLEYFDSSITVKEYLQNIEKEGINTEKVKGLSEMIGEAIAKMHFNNIIHGDLTTSNFLLIKNSETGKEELAVIDFGLSHSEASDEDKGVDLYVLERALLSTHVNILEFFTEILKKYCSVYGKKSGIVLKKFEEVRARGRKRSMVGTLKPLKFTIPTTTEPKKESMNMQTDEVHTINLSALYSFSKDKSEQIKKMEKIKFMKKNNNKENRKIKPMIEINNSLKNCQRIAHK